MMRVVGQYHIKVASDIVRDGLGAERWSDRDELVAEVFRCDASHTISLQTFNTGVPMEVVESFIKFARERLEPFEDGTLLPPTQPVEMQ